jgi:hypothetical protein
MRQPGAGGAADLGGLRQHVHVAFLTAPHRGTGRARAAATRTTATVSQSTPRGGGTCPTERSGLASGLMMIGHEIGTALGVAALTGIAGDLTTAAGLIDGYGRALTVTAGVLGALFVLTRPPFPPTSPRPVWESTGTAGTGTDSGQLGGAAGTRRTAQRSVCTPAAPLSPASARARPSHRQSAAGSSHPRSPSTAAVPAAAFRSPGRRCRRSRPHAGAPHDLRPRTRRAIPRAEADLRRAPGPARRVCSPPSLATSSPLHRHLSGTRSRRRPRPRWAGR